MKYSVSKILLWIAATIMILINYLAMFRNTNIGRPIFILYTIVAIITLITFPMFLYKTQYKPDMAQGVKFGI